MVAKSTGVTDSPEILNKHQDFGESDVVEYEND